MRAPAVPASAVNTAQPWRCHTCGVLLGLEQGGELHVKYKDLQHWIIGRCRHVYRRCGAVNTLQTVTSLPLSLGRER